MSQYVKNDCEQGFVTDNAEIDSLKFNNLRHTILGCMLGDFDVEGNYVVDPVIVNELIAMPKYIVDTVDNIDVCSSVIKLDKQITFFVTYEGEHAVLTLAEKVNFQANFKTNSGLFSNINEYVLDTFETSGVVDKNAVYSKWNISTFTGNALDVFNMDEETLAQYVGIVNRFKYLMKANQILLKNENKLEEIESDYAVQILQIVSRYPELKKCVDAKVKEVVSKQPSVLRLDKPFFAKTVNEIVSQTIENNLNVLTDSERQEFQVEKRNIVLERNLKIAQTIETSNAPVVDENQEVVTSKFVVNTFGAETRQSLTDVATEYIVAKNETNAAVSQQAVAESLGAKQKENYISTTNTTTVEAKQMLIEELSKISGQTHQQFARVLTDETTQAVISSIEDKVDTKQEVKSSAPNLVAQVAETKQTATTKPVAGVKKDVKKATKPTEKKSEVKKSTNKTTDGKTSNAGTKPTTAAKSEPQKDYDFDTTLGGDTQEQSSVRTDVQKAEQPRQANLTKLLAEGLDDWERKTQEEMISKALQNDNTVSTNGATSQTETKVTMPLEQTVNQTISPAVKVEEIGEQIDKII